MDKKIVYIGGFRFPSGDAASQRVLNNARIFRELGFKVEFISWGGRPNKSDIRKDGFYYYQGFKYINTFEIDRKGLNPIKRTYNYFFRGRNSLRVLLESINETDIIIAYNPPSFFTRKILTLCEKHNIFFIADITEWYAANELPGGIFALPYWINEYNMKVIQKRIQNKILTSSFLDKYYSLSNNIILPPLVDISEEKWNKEKKQIQSFDCLRVIYAGTPGKKDLLEKMLSAVIDCIKDGVNIQFIVVGVERNNICHYTNYNELLFYSDNIIFCGRVPQDEVPSFYKAADFSLIVRESNRKNNAGFPTKLAESMIAGCPVIVNETSDIGNYIIHEKNGVILKNSSISELKNTLMLISSLSKEKIGYLKLNAYKTAIDSFNYNNYINLMKTFIYNLKK